MLQKREVLKLWQKRINRGKKVEGARCFVCVSSARLTAKPLRHLQRRAVTFQLHHHELKQRNHPSTVSCAAWEIEQSRTTYTQDFYAISFYCRLPLQISKRCFVDYETPHVVDWMSQQP
jgi:hypothetical protein